MESEVNRGTESGPVGLTTGHTQPFERLSVFGPLFPFSTLIYLYALRCGDFLKIGIAEDVRARIDTLQIGNPHEITVAGAFPVEGTRAAKAERRLHARLAPYRHRGEWFSAPWDVALRAIRDELGAAQAEVAADRSETWGHADLERQIMKAMAGAARH